MPAISDALEDEPMTDPNDPSDEVGGSTHQPGIPAPADRAPSSSGGAPYREDLSPRAPIDHARPWLEAGRSWEARAEQLRAYLDQRRGRPRRRWESKDRGLVDLEARAAACRAHAHDLDRLTATGWAVWHDRVLVGTRDVIDHVLIGPAGVVLIQTQPGLDHIAPPIGRSPGPRTQAAIAANNHLLHTTIGPAVVDAVHAALPTWTITTHWIQVLHDPTIRLWFTDVSRPELIGPWLTQLGAPFAPTHVFDIATTIETVLPPAPLAG